MRLAPGPGDGLILLRHRGTKRYTTAALADARAAGAEVVVVSGIGIAGSRDRDRRARAIVRYTASHLGALLRLAQIATALGADLGRLEVIPNAVKQ